MDSYEGSYCLIWICRQIKRSYLDFKINSTIMIEHD